MKTRNASLIVCLFVASLIAPLHAQEGEEKAPEVKAEPRSSTTTHSVKIEGQTFEYTATAGWLIMENDEGQPIAQFGYTAYTQDGANPASRPIMFAFNGGPGSSSLWLHMGILGPRRVVINDAGFAAPPPSNRVPNEYSIIDVTDLVMIDPVGTGYSRPLGEAKGEQFWGVDQDIESVGAFIKKYVTQNRRWASPKYILGESYGGVRSAGLVWHLQNQHGMNFNGVIVVSPFLNMVSGVDGADIDMPHVLYLSTLAATAWYHDMVKDDSGNKPENLASFVAEVDRFAFEEYAPALMKGYTISDSEKQGVAEKLAAYTGTSVDYWTKADLRVSHQQFLQELKRDQRLIAGRIDSRFVGPAVNPLGETMDYDPFFPSVGPAYTSAFLDYMNNELEFGDDLEYTVSGGLFGQWDWGHKPPGSNFKYPWADLRADLAMALTMNPGLHLLVQQGYFDLATPTLATKYDISHLDIPPEARERIQMEFYEAGHMMYLHQESMEKFREDLATFVRDTDRL
jgi:carboxypeptidase C (cathepsin A)